jgi:hypothetical protein
LKEQLTMIQGTPGDQEGSLPNLETIMTNQYETGRFQGGCKYQDLAVLDSHQPFPGNISQAKHTTGIK